MWITHVIQFLTRTQIYTVSNYEKSKSQLKKAPTTRQAKSVDLNKINATSLNKVYEEDEKDDDYHRAEQLNDDQNEEG